MPELRKRYACFALRFALRGFEVRNDLGARLRHVRASRNQQEMADVMGVAKRTYASYERNERVPDALMLAPLIVEGWSGSWLITGQGPDRLEARQDGDETSVQSQDLNQARLTLALQTVEDVLAATDAMLPASKRAEAAMLVYELLGSGLPQAEVIPLARRAVGLAQGGSNGDRGAAAASR